MAIQIFSPLETTLREPIMSEEASSMMRLGADAANFELISMFCSGMPGMEKSIRVSDLPETEVWLA